MPRLGPPVATLLGLFLLTGCADGSAVGGVDVPASTIPTVNTEPPPATLPPSTLRMPSSGSPYLGCPSRPASFAATFLRFAGQNYRGDGQSTLKDADKGAELFRVGCPAEGSAGVADPAPAICAPEA
jgi:hypothetical protein